MKLPLVLTALIAAQLSLPALAQDVIRIRLAHSLSTSEPAHVASPGPDAALADPSWGARETNQHGPLHGAGLHRRLARSPLGALIESVGTPPLG